MRLGELILIALNAEPYVRVGQEVASSVPSTYQRLVLGYANGLFGYLPDREAFEANPQERGYPLDDLARWYFHRPLVAREAVDQTMSLVTEALADLGI